MIRYNGLLLSVTLRRLVGSYNVVFEFVKHDLRQEDIISDMMRSPESAAVHVVGKDGLETRPMTVKKVLLSLSVIEWPAVVLVSEQRVWMTCKHFTTKLEMLPAHVHVYAITVVQLTLLK